LPVRLFGFGKPTVFPEVVQQVFIGFENVAKRAEAEGSPGLRSDASARQARKAFDLFRLGLFGKSQYL
jgi:hypothetical protein